MVELKKEELLSIEGGSSIWTSSFLNALSKAANTLYDLGRSFGSSIIRSIRGKVCPV